MIRNVAFLSLALCVLSAAHPLPPQAREDMSRVLKFEGPGAAGSLDPWKVRPSEAAGTVVLDSTVAHEGEYSARLERTAASRSKFSALGIELPIDFSGDSLEVRGWLKYDGVTDFAGLWLREDGESGTLVLDNMQRRGLAGSADWAEYRIALPIHPRATKLLAGALLSGSGKVWVDDVRLYVDGSPLKDVSVFVRRPTVQDTDREFDAGSRNQANALTPAQVENLVLLGKVWGFLKYHHPEIIAGKRQWDYDLFRVMPSVLTARDRAAAQKALASWVASLGDAPPCRSCVPAPQGLPVLPRLAWLEDRTLLGADLSARLLTIYARRPKVDEQFYVSSVPRIGNPIFDNEMSYADLKEPDAGYRLLALYRFWNIIEYWYPNRDIIDGNWDGVLREFIPRVAAARTHDGYARATIALIARISDTHANLVGPLDTIRPPQGKAQVPVIVRSIQDRFVITDYAHPVLGPASGLRIGDAIRAIDGVAVMDLVKRWRPMYAASNEASRMRDIARWLTNGNPGPVRLRVEREGATLDLNAARVSADSLDFTAGRTHDLPGPTFRRLSPEVAYLKLSSVKNEEADEYVRGALGAKCLIVDIRNYPSAFLVFDFVPHLMRDSTAFVRITTGDPRNPGAFNWRGPPLRVPPAKPYFEGGVAILVDEMTQSSAEYHAMALRARPGAVVVGSTTAAADGNVSPIPLPGGLRTLISGIGVFYPDKRPTQRVGIVPDLVVRPTIAGVRAGRDEVLEAAIQRVLGRPVTNAERSAMGMDRVGAR